MQTKTVIITGASSGIGLGLAAAYLALGYHVIGNARTIARLEAVAAQSAQPAHFIPVAGDIGQRDTAEQLVATAMSRFGRIDILVNNAGIFQSKPFTAYTSGDLDALINTNLKGFFHTSQLVAEQMAHQGGGHIVNVTAAIASQPLKEVPASLPILIKGGLNAVTKALALEYADRQVCVNAVAPGIIDTPLYDAAIHGFLNTLQPVGRIGKVQEIVDAVLYLTGSSFTTGVVLSVDGGMTSGKW